MSYPFEPALRDKVAENLSQFERIPIALDDRRHAAVALIVTKNEAGDACYLVTRRSDSLRAHSGQLAFPGGRIDAGETPLEAALRETREEIGLHLTEAEVVGQLDDYATRSGYVMTPFVAWVEDPSSIEPNPAEVQSVFHVPLNTLDPPDAPVLVTIAESDRPVIQVPIRDGYLYAPSAAIVFQLYEVGVHGRSTRVAHYEQPLWAWS